MVHSSGIAPAIYIPGINSGTFEPFIVDDRWLLDHVETENLFVPLELPDRWRTTWDGYTTNVSLNEFSCRFRGLAEPLAMYGMALRQADPLAEYLCLYRICEWADNTNGKSFINKNVDIIGTHDFGELRMNYLTAAHEQPSLNVFETYRERAMSA